MTKLVSGLLPLTSSQQDMKLSPLYHPPIYYLLVLLIYLFALLLQNIIQFSSLFICNELDNGVQHRSSSSGCTGDTRKRRRTKCTKSARSKSRWIGLRMS
mmetsp:Transcript_32146/g.48181  ORF Transcript_32146/g.48181 Transcript_32146/m.48181 type:complete len:100 (+) Transcript_32146:221-520(+)